MDSLDLNGGNTLLERKEYNLDHDILLNTSEKQSFEEENTSDKEFNSDPSSLILKKNIAISRKKFRKSTGGLSNSKENTEFTALSSTLNLNKRKISDSAELSSGESDEFNGFDLKDLEIFGHGSNILKSLLDEAELYNNSFIKRRKTSCSIWKNVKNADSLIEDTDANTTDSEDQKISIESEMQNVADESSIKSEKSADSSISACSSRSKIKRISYGASPVTTTRQKVSIDINNPAYKEPFNYGWKRELVYRAGSLENQGRRMADIYYYTPEGKKVRSYREVFEFLTTSELTIDNFTFFKEPLGINDPNKEIIRDAKKAKDYSSSKATIKTSKKITDFSAKRSSLSKRGVDILNLEIESTQTTPKIMKTAGTFKVKLPTKKHTVKKETSSLVAPVILKDEVSSPSKWNSPITKRTQQQEQSTIKAKKMIKRKVQEPCSIRCSRSMGLIPSLQCSACLCLYHPECTENVQRCHNFICKNCQFETIESQQNQSNQILSPPPLIPISMLNAQNSKSIHQTEFLPKLQRIPKSDNLYTPLPFSLTTNISQYAHSDKKENFSCLKSDHELRIEQGLRHVHFSQNIASVSGKKFIIIPKNNTMAVQPSVIFEQEKVADKPPVFRDPDQFCMTGTAEMCNNLLSNSQMESKKLNENDPNNISERDRLSDTISEKKNPETLNSKKIIINSYKYPLSVNLNNSNSFFSSEEKEINPPNQRLPVKNIPQEENQRKKSCQSEVENRQYFMISLCAGYHALSRIFQYLKVQELLRAARVCRMWRDLAAHPSLWKTVRMKNSQVTDWDGLADTLKSRGTQHLDLRKMLIAGEADVIWKKFVATIPQVTSLIKLELCRCPAIVVEEVMKNCPQLQVLSAMSIKCDTLNLEFVDNLYQCQELRLKAISGMSLQGDLMPLLKLSKITHLSLTSVKDLGKKKIEVLHSLQNLETLELGECSDFPEKFGTSILLKLQNLEKLRLEKGQGTCCTFDILEGISKLKNLTQLELVNFDVKNGFDKYLANCKNIKRLLVIPTYVSQSATSNNMILGGVTELSNNLTHFVWGVTQELLRVTELFVDQCNQMNKQITGDSIPVLKPVPCLELIEDVLDDNIQDDKQQSNLSNPQVQILPLPHLQKLLLTALPKTRVKILKIPFHATWRQSISDSTT